MLDDFLKANRTELIARCRTKAAKRSPGTTPSDSQHGIPALLDQLVETFRKEQTPEALARHKAGKPSLVLVPSDIAGTAAKHGRAMRAEGLTVAQVVHGYGDLCQAVTELAMEKDCRISADEFHTFNRCLDDAIADAVTSYTEDSGDTTPASAAARMSRHIEAALQSFAAMKSGAVGTSGTTAAMHEKSLIAVRDLLAEAAGRGDNAREVGINL